MVFLSQYRKLHQLRICNSYLMNSIPYNQGTMSSILKPDV